MTNVGKLLTAAVILAILGVVAVGILLKHRGGTMNYNVQNNDEGWHDIYNGTVFERDPNRPQDPQGALDIPSFTTDNTPNYDWRLSRQGTESDYSFLIQKNTGTGVFDLTLTDDAHPTPGTVTHHESWTACKPAIRARDLQG